MTWISIIRNWLSDMKYEEDREQYFIGNLSGQQINLTMKEIKWLTKTFKELDIVTIEDRDGNITQISLQYKYIFRLQSIFKGNK